MSGWYTNLLAPAHDCVDDTVMMKTLGQWISRAIALALLGPLAASVAGRLVAIDGSSEHTMLTSDGFVSGLIALLIVGALTLVSGVIGNVLGNRREGFLAMGFVLGWVAWTSGRIGRIYLLNPEPGTGVMLAFEALVLLIFVIATGVAMSRASEVDPISSFSPKHLMGWIKERSMLGAMGVALIVAGVVSFVFGSYDFPGQSLGVGFLAGVLAGVAGALAAASLAGEGNHKGTPYAPLMIGVMFAGVIFSLLTIVYPGLGSIEQMVLKGELPGFVVVSPAAWMSGALLGVPMGHSWVEHSHANVKSAATSKN